MSPHPEVRRRKLLGRGARLALAALVAGPAGPASRPARAQQGGQRGVELTSLRASRADGALSLDFTVRVSLPRAVEEALMRGVPVYFVAQATLWRRRWYWRDERVARVARQWRVAFQPLTGHWRVGLGGLNQNHATLDEALASASRGAGWKLAELSQIDPGQGYTVEFEYRLDISQLPSPMQFGLVTQGDWAVGVTRVLKVQ